MRRNYYRHRAIPGLALAAFTAATLAGCTLPPVPVEAPESTTVAEPVDESVDEPVDEPVTPTAAQPEGTFGKGAVKYDDGLTITLSQPETFTPDETAFIEGSNPHYVKFTVTITNDTDERFDPLLTYISLASGDVEGTPVYDVVNGLSSPPETAIVPGKSRSWVVAFGVTDPDDLIAQVGMGDLVHDDALFTLR